MFEMGANRGGEFESVSFQEFEGKELTDSLHQHSFFELCFMVRGSGRWQIGAASGRFAAGSLVLCPPHFLHAWRSEPVAGEKAACAGIVLRFRREALPAALLKLPEMAALARLQESFGGPLFFDVSDRERLRSRLRSVDRAQGPLRLARFYVALELIAGFGYSQVVDEHHDSNTLSARDLARREALRRFIQARFKGELSRGEAARLVGLDEAAFSRFFKRVMGTTFVAYVSSFRVRQAAALLGSRRDLSMGEVAAQSGFGSLASLHRQFKKRLGTTPDSYRKAANSEVLAP